MTYNSFWTELVRKAIEIGIEDNYFAHAGDCDSPSMELSHTGLKRCTYILSVAPDAGCCIKINHSIQTWNQKVFDLVQSCASELEESIGTALMFDSEQLTIGLYKNPKLPAVYYQWGETDQSELAIHLLRCFFILLEEVDHVILNAMDTAY